MTNEEEHYVYVYLDPRKNKKFYYTRKLEKKPYITPNEKGVISRYEPFYVGKGKGNRAQKHLERVKNGNLRDSNIRLYKRIKEILSDNKEPFIRIVKKTYDPEEALYLESLLIQTIGRAGYGEGPLLNIDDGKKEEKELKAPIYLNKSDIEKFSILCHNKGRKIGDVISELIRHQIKMEWNEEYEEINKMKHDIVLSKYLLKDLTPDNRKKIKDNKDFITQVHSVLKDIDNKCYIDCNLIHIHDNIPNYNFNYTVPLHQCRDYYEILLWVHLLCTKILSEPMIIWKFIEIACKANKLDLDGKDFNLI